jgi:tripartite-type tricarboxylate transporter receptor subunit TctC
MRLRLRFLACLMFVVLLAISFINKVEAAFPDKTITILCPAAPGGSTDLTARMLAKSLTEILKVPVVVENKTGGGGFIAGSSIYNAAPDGYNLFVTYSSSFTLTHFLRNPPYDIFKMTPILSYGIYPFTLAVKADSEWKTFKDFIDYAKAHPGKVGLATSNPTSMENLPIWMLEEKLGLKMKLVPYDGGAPAVAAVLGGHAHAFTGVAEAIPHIRDGSMRGLATYLSARMPGLPDVPTLKELGYEVVVESRLALLGPPGVPKETVKILQDAFRKAMESPDFVKICSAFEVTSSFMDGAAMDKYHRDLAAETKEILIRIGKIEK